MAEFTLDTSGAVRAYPLVRFNDRAETPVVIRWPDLSPFAQGYVEAAFAEAEGEGPCMFEGPSEEPSRGHRKEVWVRKGFSDLAPATLAAMLRDCEVFEAMYGPHTADPSIYGRVFWEKRQAGDYDQEPFPPLTLYLGEDGKIHQREVGQ